ncbi:hypothetical protein Henu12_gp48 [Shigella phage Henu12]|nr:hypothetical protein Henu12_gp48 [Shigella phage Henu12]
MGRLSVKWVTQWLHGIRENLGRKLDGVSLMKFYTIWGRVGKGYDWILLKTNVKSNEIVYYKVYYHKTFREVEYREQ